MSTPAGSRSPKATNKIFTLSCFSMNKATGVWSWRITSISGFESDIVETRSGEKVWTCERCRIVYLSARLNLRMRIRLWRLSWPCPLILAPCGQDNVALCYSVWHTWARGPSREVGIATGWTVRGSNPFGGEIFRNCPDRPWTPPTLLYNGYRVLHGGINRSGRDANPSSPSSAVVMKG